LRAFFEKRITQKVMGKVSAELKVGPVSAQAQAIMKVIHTTPASDVRSCGPSGTLVIIQEQPVDMNLASDRTLVDRVRCEFGIPLPYWLEKPAPRNKGSTPGA